MYSHMICILSSIQFQCDISYVGVMYAAFLVDGSLTGGKDRQVS